MPASVLRILSECFSAIEVVDLCNPLEGVFTVFRVVVDLKLSEDLGGIVSAIFFSRVRRFDSSILLFIT